MKNDGGPAYPGGFHPSSQEADDDTYPMYPGMSLRDWFAGQALLGIVNHWQKFCEDHFDDPSLEEPQRRWHKRAAAQAYQYADALLEAREASRQPEQENPDA